MKHLKILVVDITDGSIWLRVDDLNNSHKEVDSDIAVKRVLGALAAIADSLI